jgi:S-DNA-T family DNA segregation ATPase FtsK/SpoIIIE
MPMAKTNEKKGPAKKGSYSPFRDERLKIITGAFIILFSLYLLLAFVSYLFTWKIDQSFKWADIFSGAEIQVDNWSGKAGAWFSSLFLNRWFGISSFLFPVLLLVLGFRLIRIKITHLGRTFRIIIVAIILLSVSLGYLFGSTGGFLGSGLGGAHGYLVSRWLNSFIGKAGTALLLIVTWLAFVLFTFRNSVEWMKAVGRRLFTKKTTVTEDSSVPAEELAFDKEENEEFTVKTVGPDETTNEKEGLSHDMTAEEEEIATDRTEVEMTVEKGHGNGEHDEMEHTGSLTELYDPTLDLSHYQFPPLHLLEDHSSGESEVSEEELLNNKNKIVETLANYKIQIDKIKATIGPTVTLYEIVPAPGVRISKIKNLEDDIALSLSALGIRIIAPIPGRGTIGIEVPNIKPQIVSMRSLITSKKFQETKYELAVALGKTISNETYVIDLARMPHILVAGATGQGKSVGLNVIIASLLYRMHPSQLKFVFIDPKKVELTLYSRIEKHFLATIPGIEEPIITDTQTVIHTLNSLTVEMEQRYNLLKSAEVRSIKEYNDKFIARHLNPARGHRYLPYIVLVVDEFADLIMTAGREVEMPLARLAQKARAIGIHIIIATQRPSINIITGTIKANFPCRIAFRVTSMMDSRTILDTPGANQLVGRGDMLYLFGSELIRLQCAYIDTSEIEKITAWIAEQQGYPTAFLLPETVDENAVEMEDFDPNKIDPLFEKAARIVVLAQQGSTSLIQRKLSIGYNRAGRIIDQLESAGIVGPSEGSKARQVLIVDEVSLEQFLKNFNPEQEISLL